MWVHTNTPTWELIGEDNGLTWVYTNTITWELIGKDDGLTWVNTDTPTWEFICTVTWVCTNTHTRERNRYRPDQTRPDQTRPDQTRPDRQTHFKSFQNRQTDRGFSTLRLFIKSYVL